MTHWQRALTVWEWNSPEKCLSPSVPPLLAVLEVEISSPRSMIIYTRIEWIVHRSHYLLVAVCTAWIFSWHTQKHILSSNFLSENNLIPTSTVNYWCLMRKLLLGLYSVVSVIMLQLLWNITFFPYIIIVFPPVLCPTATSCCKTSDVSRSGISCGCHIQLLQDKTAINPPPPPLRLPHL